MRKPFVIASSSVASRHDNDVHVISHADLMRLYRLPQFLCELVTEDQDRTYSVPLESIFSDSIVLRPRYNGDYEQHLLDRLNERLRLSRAASEREGGKG